jgi:RNA polymerase sigma-32 factor
MINQLPIISGESTLRRYLQEIKKFPVLSEAEEQKLAKSYRDNNDISAAHRLVTSHLRLVAKIASHYRGYGLPASELVAEGNIGLMQAVKKFDPDRGFRLATYAMWWIKASIQEYILRSWSLVKIGSSAAQKKLFFGLRKVKNLIRRNDNNESANATLSNQEIEFIAKKMGVETQDVIDMDTRMSAYDQNLNAKIGNDSEYELQDTLADPSDSHELILADAQEKRINNTLLFNAIAKLNDREQEIIKARHLQEQPSTLDDLSKIYNISRERIRQIEARAMEKLQKELIINNAA